MLQFGYGVRCPHVLFAARPPSVFAARLQHGGQHGVIAKRGFVSSDSFFGNFKNANAFHARWCAREILRDGFGVDANGFKQLRTAVAHVGGDTHLRHDLGQTLTNCFDVVIDGFVCSEVALHILVQFDQSLHGQVRMNRFSAVACEHTKVMYFTGSACLDDQASCGAQACSHQMLMNCR